MSTTLGDFIRSRREAVGMDRATLAERSGFKRSSNISNIELGLQDVTRDAFVRIAEALEIPEAEWPDVLRLPKDEPDPATAPDPTPAAA